MKQLNVDDSKQPGFVCAMDAKEQFAKFWPTFSTSAQQQAKDLQVLAHNAYGVNGSKVYLNAREQFLVIKVDHPKVSVTWLAAKELEAMNKFVVANGITVLATKKNLLFRIK